VIEYLSDRFGGSMRLALLPSGVGMMTATTTFGAVLVVLMMTGVASAETPSPNSTAHELPHLNMAAAVGMNSPTGMIGIEADYRVMRYFSAGLAGGYGLWGYRISPTAKLELPINASTGIFVEGAVSFNTGGSGYTEQNGVRQEFDRGLVPAASINVGGRVKKWGPLWTGARVGVSFALRKNAYEVMGSEPTTELTQDLLDAAYPGGLVVSWMAGAAF
jgi:hypothetical protein